LSGLQEGLQHAGVLRTAQALERLRFDLTDTLAGHVVVAADILKRLLGTGQTEAAADDIRLAGGQVVQDLRQLLT